jgi:hypothetical protein
VSDVFDTCTQVLTLALEAPAPPPSPPSLPSMTLHDSDPETPRAPLAGKRTRSGRFVLAGRAVNPAATRPASHVPRLIHIRGARRDFDSARQEDTEFLAQFNAVLTPGEGYQAWMTAAQLRADFGDDLARLGSGDVKMLATNLDDPEPDRKASGLSGPAGRRSRRLAQRASLPG